MNKRGSYNRSVRHITLDKALGAWIKSIPGAETAQIIEDAIDTYRMSDLPPQEQLPPMADRERAPYAVDDDAFGDLQAWCKRHDGCSVTHTIRALFREAYDTREDDGNADTFSERELEEVAG